jgi:cation-transporting P-type ATPase E
MQIAAQSEFIPTPEEALRGLSQAEVVARRKAGDGNNVTIPTSRSYQDILKANVFTFLNAVLFGIGLALVVLGLYSDALLSVGIAVMNVIVGLVQEVRAKQTLDKIALLTRPKASILRDGTLSTLDPTEIVVGDVLRVQTGDQIVVDGVLTGNGRLEVDESLLTGESDLVHKDPGNTLYSGSFVVSGSGYYTAEKVGLGSLANQLTSGARVFKQVKTPLQIDVDLIVRLLVALTLLLSILFGLASIVNGVTVAESVRIAAVLTGLIPNGLLFMTSIAYAMGAVRMAGRGALIQQSNAVESLSNVNVLCLDKTGTLTANRIQVHQIMALQGGEAAIQQQLGIFAASSGDGNRTVEALSAAFPEQPQPVIDRMPFSSARKWSALSFDTPTLRGVYVLGAPEMLRPHLADTSDLGHTMYEWMQQGLRVLLFAYQEEPTPLHDTLGQPQLPPDLKPLGIISMKDELRPGAGDTLKEFIDTGITLKIISGDNPQTVAALARQAGMPGELHMVSGAQLEEMNEQQFSEAAQTATIFGRISPQQKEQLVDTLRSHGHYVAMIGDGVNDVLSLKKAQIGIAMQSGSQATRGVADMILMNDSFAALPAAFREGQRIVSGMMDIMRLFLVRVIYQTLIIIGIAIIGLSFPITPVHMSLLTFMTVGLPTLALAAWAKPATIHSRVIDATARFIFPAGVSLALVGIGIYITYYTAYCPVLCRDLSNVSSELLTNAALGQGLPLSEVVENAHAEAVAYAQTMLTITTTLAGLILLVFVQPPTQFWVGGDSYSGDWRPTLMALILGVGFVGVMLYDPLREFFEMEAITGRDVLVVTALLTVWTLGLRYMWRARWFIRFAGLA